MFLGILKKFAERERDRKRERIFNGDMFSRRRK